MRARFVASEVAIGLRRNLTMTIAVIVTVAISLALLGAGLLIRDQVSTMKDFWYDKVEVSVFLCITKGPGGCAGGATTPQQRDQLNADIAANPLVKQVFYESKQDAYKRFQQQFKDAPDLVKNVQPEQLPESFRIKLKNPTQFAALASAYVDRPGVQSVIDQRAVLQRFFKLLNGLQLAALLVAVIQIGAAALLISNTIRVAAFSRRRETAIMRLVGASNAYIQMPFLLEGALAGLAGAVLASGALFVMKGTFIDHQLRPTLKFTAFIGWDAVWSTVPVLVLTGVLLSGAASFFTLRRYLRV